MNSTAKPRQRTSLWSAFPGIHICAILHSGFSSDRINLLPFTFVQFLRHDIYFLYTQLIRCNRCDFFCILSQITFCNVMLQVWKVKGMSRSGTEGWGVTTWPADRSPGVIPCRRQPQHLRGQLTGPSPTEHSTGARAANPGASLCWCSAMLASSQGSVCCLW